MLPDVDDEGVSKFKARFKKGRVNKSSLLNFFMKNYSFGMTGISAFADADL